MIYNRIDDNNDLCIAFSMVAISYFLITIPFGFVDMILPFVNINCPSNGLKLNIFDWMLINGIFMLLSFISIVIIRKSGDSFTYKLFKAFNIVFTIFIAIWSIVGCIIFFKYYFTENILQQNCDNGFINYLTVRMIIAPFTAFFKIMELWSL